MPGREDQTNENRETLNKVEVPGTSNTMSDHLDSKDLEQLNDKEYKQYCIRWLIIVFFTTTLAASGLGNIGFAAISPIIKRCYGVSDLAVTFLVLPAVILFVPLIFPANYLYDNYGMRVPIILASLFNIAGAWVRQFVNYNFYILMAGQVVMAIGQPLILSAPAKVAAMWFGDNERAIATMIGSLAGPLGATAGYLLPLPLISDKDTPDGKCDQHGKDKFFTFVLVSNIVITVWSLPIIFLIRDKPPTPPSASAEKIMKTKKTGQIRDIMVILKNRDFLIIMWAFSCIYCIYTVLGACLGPLSEQFNYTSTDNSVFGMCFLIAGVVGSFFHAFCLDKFKQYKIQYIIIGILCVAVMGVTTYLIKYTNLYITGVCIACLGGAQLPIVGVSYAFTAELTYPINEALSCGFLQLSGSVIASIFTFVMGALLDQKLRYVVLFMLIGISFLGFLPMPFIRQILKKSKAGMKQSSLSFYAGNTSFVESMGMEQGSNRITYQENEVEKIEATPKLPAKETRRPLLDD